MADYYAKSDSGSIGSGTFRGEWQASQTWAAGDRVVPTQAYGVAASKFRVYECTTGGTGGGTEPTWNASPGNTTADGSATFTCRACTTWADANVYLLYLSLGEAAGDNLFVASDHVETLAAAWSASWAGTVVSPNRIFSADKTSGEPPSVLQPGAAISTTGSNQLRLNFSGFLHAEGLVLTAGTGTDNANMRINDAGSSVSKYKGLTLILGGNNATPRIELMATSGSIPWLVDSWWRFAHASQAISAGGGTGGAFKISGGGLLSGGVSPTTMFQVTTSANVLIEGVDLSAAATGMNLFGSSSPSVRALIINSKLPSGWTGQLNSSTPGAGATYDLVNCSAGDENYVYRRKTQMGEIFSETGRVRSGGATDGVTPISWRMVTNSNAEWQHLSLDTREIARWFPRPGSGESLGSPITVSVDILHDSITNLSNKDIWIHVQYLGTNGFPLSMFIDDAAASYTASAANQDASSATWDTTGMSNPNKQKLSVTFTPQEAGYILVTVMMAKPSYTVYVDPKLQISS